MADFSPLLQDSTAGSARINLQSDAGSFILLQLTTIDTPVALEPTKDYYLLQEDEFLIVLEDSSGFLILEESSDVSDQIEIQIPLTKVPEETTFTATVYFRARGSMAASIPTTIHYRVDCLSTKQQIADWTAVAIPAASNEIIMTSVYNQILGDRHNNETKQLTVKTDSGLTTQVIKPKRWKVCNLLGIE
jgi:hypothetical protein